MKIKIVIMTSQLLSMVALKRINQITFQKTEKCSEKKCYVKIKTCNKSTWNKKL